MFAAALGSPRTPSDPRCGYHAFLVQAVKLNGALSSPPCRGVAAACLAQGAAVLSVQWWGPAVPCRASPARLAVLPRVQRLQRASFPVIAKEEGAQLRFSL